MLWPASMVNVVMVVFSYTASCAVITFITPVAGTSKRNLTRSEENVSAPSTGCKPESCAQSSREAGVQLTPAGLTFPRRGGMNVTPMRKKTKFLRLRQAVAWGHEIDGWQVCWLGGWDKWRVFYIVMVMKRPTAAKKKAGTGGWAGPRGCGGLG